MKTLFLYCLLALLVQGADNGKPLFNGRNLDGWEVVGDGFWHVLKDGTVVGERIARKTGPPDHWFATPAEFRAWRDTQSWLYTARNDYDEFDLHLEYWLHTVGNSGVSLRDPTRGKYGVITPPDYKRTPSKLGYEIQINNGYPDPHPTGSIYGFVDAKTGAQNENDWNAMDIEVRRGGILVKLNGQLVAEHAGDPARPRTGPIGLQLHDQYCVVMFRNVRVREINR